MGKKEEDEPAEREGWWGVKYGLFPVSQFQGRALE